MREVAPLPGTFMITSIIGFFISIYLVMPLSETWGFTFTLVFVLMFVSSFISMTRADPTAELELDRLAFHNEGFEERGDEDVKEVPPRWKVEKMTKDEIEEYADEEWNVDLTTDDLKREMIDQLFDEIQ